MTDDETTGSDAGDDPSGPTLVDARGKACPIPVIELARTVETIAVGERVELLADDPAARVDIPVWCRMRKQTLVSSTQDAGTWTFVVERAG